MNQLRAFAVLVAALGLAIALPAAAVVKVATYSGIIAGGYDQTGVFGTPETDLAGLHWVAQYTYDKTLGVYQVTEGADYDESAGGSQFGGLAPIILAEITINGVTRSTKGSYVGTIQTGSRPASLPHLVRHFAQDLSDNGIIYRENWIYSYMHPAEAPGSLNSNFGPISAANAYGTMQFLTYNRLEGYIEYASADLGADMVYSVSNAVPEPETWALMIAGFGMIGSVLRRRNQWLMAA